MSHSAAPLMIEHHRSSRVYSEAVSNYAKSWDRVLLDRIDLQIEISPLSFEEMSLNTVNEPSSAIRQRVVRARAIQEERYKDHPLIHCNAQMTSALLRQYCELDDKALIVLKNAMSKLDLSARAYDRILKVSRSIADYEGEDKITSTHIAEAIAYRNLDRRNRGL